jgi:hypothetical protein
MSTAREGEIVEQGRPPNPPLPSTEARPLHSHYRETMISKSGTHNIYLDNFHNRLRGGEDRSSERDDNREHLTFNLGSRVINIQVMVRHAAGGVAEDNSVFVYLSNRCEDGEELLLSAKLSYHREPEETELPRKKSLRLPRGKRHALLAFKSSECGKFCDRKGALRLRLDITAYDYVISTEGTGYEESAELTEQVGQDSEAAPTQPDAEPGAVTTDRSTDEQWSGLHATPPEDNQPSM